MPHDPDVASPRRIHRCDDCELDFNWPGDLDLHRRRRHPDDDFHPAPPPPATLAWLNEARSQERVICDFDLAGYLRAA